MRKPAYWIAAVAILVVAGYWAYRQRHPSLRPAYKTAAIETRNIIVRVTASGTLSALVTVQVGTQVSGRVQKLFVDYNSPVKKGEPVAKIDPQLFEAQVRQSQANYLSAKAGVSVAEANAANADRQYVRAKALHEENLASQADLDTAETGASVAHANIEAAKAALAQAEAQLNQAQVNLSFTTIVSPIDGVVISRSVDPGQTVAASLSAPTLFTIAQDLTKMQVDTNVAEGDIGRLQVGMKAYFTVDSFPGESFRGQIRQIRNAATTVQNVVTYDAVIDVDNSDMRLRPGMTANVTVICDERRHVLAVPNAALRFRPPAAVAEGASHERGRHGTEGDGGASSSRPRSGDSDGTSAESGVVKRGYVPSPSAPVAKPIWVLRGDVPQMVLIHAGASDGTITEIIGDQVAEGDRVVVDMLDAEGTPAAAAGTSTSLRRLF